MAIDGTLYFRWQVALGGYCWLDLDAPSGKLRVMATGLADGLWTTEYRPLEDPDTSGLFRIFAEAEDSEAGFLAFANKYGSLLERGDPGETSMFTVQGWPGHEPGAGWGERLETWATEVHDMRRCVQLWDALRNQNLPMLRDSMEVHCERAGGAWVVPRDGGQHVYLPEEVATQAPGVDLVKAAYIYIAALSNERLGEHTAPRLLYSPKKQRPLVFLMPRNLLGALWLQFAKAVEGNKVYHRCQGPGCGQWYEVDPDKNRTSKLFCSTACRSKAYRERKADAVRRYGEGQSLEEIATALGSDVETVRGWVCDRG